MVCATHSRKMCVFPVYTKWKQFILKYVFQASTPRPGPGQPTISDRSRLHSSQLSRVSNRQCVQPDGANGRRHHSLCYGQWLWLWCLSRDDRDGLPWTWTRKKSWARMGPIGTKKYSFENERLACWYSASADRRCLFSPCKGCMIRFNVNFKISLFC